MNQSTYQKRIGWEGDIKPLLIKVCQDYNIGNYKRHSMTSFYYIKTGHIKPSQRAPIGLNRFLIPSIEIISML